MDRVEANLLQARAEGHTVREDSPTVLVCGIARFPAGLVNGTDLEAVGRGGTSVVGGGVPDECALSASTHESDTTTAPSTSAPTTPSRLPIAKGR